MAQHIQEKDQNPPSCVHFYLDCLKFIMWAFENHHLKQIYYFYDIKARKSQMTNKHGKLLGAFLLFCVINSEINDN